MRFFALFMVGTAAGAMIALQSVLNSVLGKRAGDLGSVFVLTLISSAVLLPLMLFFPSTANFRHLPGASEWYLYLGGILGIVILAAPILLVPRIGATSTVTALVVGQLALAVVLDHFGVLGLPRAEITPAKVLGLLLLILATLLLVRR